MPLLVDPALPAGALASLPQPSLGIDERLALRPWRGSDAPTVRAAFSCPEIQRWHVRRIDTAQEARGWIGRWAQRWQAEQDASWAIVDGDVPQPVGQVGLRSISLFEASASLSYWVLPTVRGGGTAGRAVARLTSWAFDRLGLVRLTLQHSTHNRPSCRVAEKSGYALEGVLRRAMRHADGWHDVHLHARLTAALGDAGSATSPTSPASSTSSAPLRAGGWPGSATRPGCAPTA